MLVDPATAIAAGVVAIAPDRPGYGLSTFQKARTLAGWSRDVAELAGHLGLDRFAVVGISGGGPHAAGSCLTVWARRGGQRHRRPRRARVRGRDDGDQPPVHPRRPRGPETNALPFGLTTVLGRRAPDRIREMLLKAVPEPDQAVLQRRPEVRAALLSDLDHASATTGRAGAQEFGLFAPT